MENIFSSVVFLYIFCVARLLRWLDIFESKVETDCFILPNVSVLNK